MIEVQDLFEAGRENAVKEKEGMSARDVTVGKSENKKGSA
jgi:hypothetical protein